MLTIRSIRNWVLLAGLIVSMQVVPTQAQTPAPPLNALSLEDARRAAFLKNWDLLAARSDVDGATAQRLVSREFPNPSLSLGTSKINVDGHPSSTAEGNGFWDRNYDSVAAISQLIEIGGKRAARKDAATAGLRGAEARLADARRLLDQAVTQAYVSALLADRNQRVLADSASSLRQEAKIAAVRQRAGDISTADQSQIEIASDRLDLDARAAEGVAHAARIQLEILLGEPKPEGNIRLADSLENLALAATTSKALDPDAGQTAGNRRPDLVAAEAMRVKADADLRLQRAQRVPDPTFSVQYEHQPLDQPNTVGFAVSFPLQLWNRNKGGIAGAEASARQAAGHADKIRAQILADIATAKSNFATAQERWRRYREDLQPKAQKVREIVAFAYQKGGASLLDLLTAQRTENEVRLAAAQSVADSANAAAALRAALDTGPPSNSIKP